MGVKEFFSGLFSETKEERVSELLLELHYRMKEINKLSKEIEELKNVIKSYQDMSGYYVGITEDSMKSSDIYANKVGFYDDKYVFYLGERVVAILSSEIYKEVVFVESEKEN